MKKLLLVFVVLALVVPAKAVIFSDDFNVGGPPDPENRSPVNWDTWATIPGNAFMKLSNRGDENLLAMVISQWGTDCGITTKASYDVTGMASLSISVETMREGWGWHLTGLVGGIFKDAGGNPLGTVLTSLTDIDHGIYFDADPAWVWFVRNATVAVPVGAATVKFPR